MANITRIRLSGTTYTIVDESAIHSLAGYATSAETQAAITAATNALAESIAEQHYQTSGDVQNAISGKADTTAVTQVNNALTAHTANTDVHVTTADKTAWNAKVDTSDLAGYADAVEYDSNAKEMKFYHGGTSGTEVFSFDASPFLVDGMIESVVITSITSGGSEVQVLEITWNSAAGSQVTDIPLSEIFDPTNYYTKSEIDTALSGKASTATTTSINNVLTAHTANTTIHVTSSDKTTWSGKQDALVSGTNIKTINGISVLGSGNIEIEQGTVDQSIIQNSTNAVAGGAVYTALAGKNGVITLDGETMVVS